VIAKNSGPKSTMPTQQTTSSEDIERFKVRSSAEIDRLLLAILEGKGFVTVYSDSLQDFLVTSIIGMDKKKRALYLGCGSDERINRALLDSASIMFTTTQDQIKVQFNTAGIERVLYENESVFKAHFPTEIIRFQRREFYRLATQILKPIKCYIPVGETSVETIVVDISVGGIGILSYRQEAHLEQDKEYHGCRLELPDSGTFLVSLSIRTTFDVTLKNGVLSHRLGCQFISLPGYVENEIQRYILRSERERRMFQN
jgi:c-di-GMP-binding flagellar brake protein YcgR